MIPTTHNGRPPHRSALGDLPLVVGIGGTTRNGSGTERVLRAGLAAAGRRGARTALLAGTDLDLPMYTPQATERSARARRLVELIARADGVIVASPAYHGAMSGLIKNALDYVEELREDERRPYLDGRAVGCIACAAGWQATTTTLMSLRSVVHALRGWPTPLGVAVNTSEPVFGSHGELTDAGALRSLDIVGEQVVSLARLQAGLVPSRADRAQPHRSSPLRPHRPVSIKEPS